jgi:hypothetical protein
VKLLWIANSACTRHFCGPGLRLRFRRGGRSSWTNNLSTIGENYFNAKALLGIFFLKDFDFSLARVDFSVINSEQAGAGVTNPGEFAVDGGRQRLQPVG